MAPALLFQGRSRKLQHLPVNELGCPSPGASSTAGYQKQDVGARLSGRALRCQVLLLELVCWSSFQDLGSQARASRSSEFTPRALLRDPGEEEGWRPGLCLGLSFPAASCRQSKPPAQPRLPGPRHPVPELPPGSVQVSGDEAELVRGILGVVSRHASSPRLWQQVQTKGSLLYFLS